MQRHLGSPRSVHLAAPPRPFGRCCCGGGAAQPCSGFHSSCSCCAYHRGSCSCPCPCSCSCRVCCCCCACCACPACCCCGRSACPAYFCCGPCAGDCAARHSCSCFAPCPCFCAARCAVLPEPADGERQLVQLIWRRCLSPGSTAVQLQELVAEHQNLQSPERGQAAAGPAAAAAEVGVGVLAAAAVPAAQPGPSRVCRLELHCLTAYLPFPPPCRAHVLQSPLRCPATEPATRGPPAASLLPAVPAVPALRAVPAALCQLRLPPQVLPEPPPEEQPAAGGRPGAPAGTHTTWPA